MKKKKVKTKRKKLATKKIVKLSKYGSAYKLDGAGYLLYAAINTNGTIDDNWNLVEQSAIEGELDVKKFRLTLMKKLGPFKISA